MCPMCASTAALIAGGATSVGGLAALLAKLRGWSVVKKIDQLFRNTGEQNELSANRIAN
jgi:hypothetical protein